jgi:hypothetical protein
VIELAWPDGFNTGADHVLALTRDKKVLSWGYGRQGQLGRRGPREAKDELDSMLTFAAVPLHAVSGTSTAAASLAQIPAFSQCRKQDSL